MGKIWVICIHIRLTQFGPRLPSRPKRSLVSCALAKLVYLFLAHTLLCLGPCHSLCLECPLPFSPFPPSILSNSHLSSYMSQIKQHLFHKAFSDFHSWCRSCFSCLCSFLVFVVVWLHLWSTPPPLEEIKSVESRDHIVSLIPHSVPSYT